MSLSKIFCTSEIGLLKKVIVHRPDMGISRISPKDAEELLFDDIVFLPQMQKEHDIFTDVLKAFIGDENVLFIADLLEESLIADEIKKAELIRMIVEDCRLPRARELYAVGFNSADILREGFHRTCLARDEVAVGLKPVFEGRVIDRHCCVEIRLQRAESDLEVLGSFRLRRWR